MNRLPAIVLAAGLSQRMGRPKVLLPWGDMTVLGKVVRTLSQAGLSEILVVTGALREQVEAEVARLFTLVPVRAVFNPGYEHGEMLSSIQAGLFPLSQRGTGAGGEGETPVEAALIALGDQPQGRPESVRQILQAYARSRPALLVPSYENHRGHPWLIRSDLWPDLLAMRPPETARDFLDRHTGEIEYVGVGSPTILQDIDTPADYQREKPG
jgi:molybdenum cofactor cytidylyltransferase